jgi:hypothetical protein
MSAISRRIISSSKCITKNASSQRGGSDAREKDNDTEPMQKEIERLKKKQQDYKEHWNNARSKAPMSLPDCCYQWEKLEELQTSLDFALAIAT